MDYPRVLDKLYALSSRGVDLGLDRVRAAAAFLGNPHQGLRCVQIAGTNGKGTVANLVAHTALEAGLKVGLFTSPHLHRFSERIRIGGIEVAPEQLGPVLNRVLGLIDKKTCSLTFFETATLAALSVFAESQVELAVLEVGLGGRLDATSIVAPEITAVTSIGYDHTELLGDTLPKIAAEKAAIARAGIPLVVGEVTPDVLGVIEDQAERVGAQLRVLDRDFRVGYEFDTPWPGEHQQKNAAVALEIVSLLGRRDPRLSEDVFYRALPTARWPGRFELIERAPRFLLDGAHNVEATRALVDALELSQVEPQVMIFGALRGKPVDEMLDLLDPRVGKIILAPPPIERALDPRIYARPGDMIAASVAEALSIAERDAGDRSTVLVTGSLFAVAEARRILLSERADPPIGL